MAKTDDQINYEEQDLIDDFMGRGYSRWAPGQFESGYHNNWNLLMPVVEKIGDMWGPPNEEGDSTELSIQADHVASQPIASHIQQVYKSVVEFIKWHNSTKQK